MKVGRDEERLGLGMVGVLVVLLVFQHGQGRGPPQPAQQVAGQQVPGNEDEDRVLDQQALQAGEEEEQQRGLVVHHPLIGGHT